MEEWMEEVSYIVTCEGKSLKSLSVADLEAGEDVATGWRPVAHGLAGKDELQGSPAFATPM